jgi:glycopeptide antibiotics resistance protein
MNAVRQARQPLLGTIVYASILTVLLIMPTSGTHVRGRYLREYDLRLTWHSLVDIAVNIAAFAPLGWGLHRVSRRLGLLTAKTTLIAVAVAVALFSLVIETVQYSLPTRYSSILDVAADTVGGILGSWLELHTGRDARSQP